MSKLIEGSSAMAIGLSEMLNRLTSDEKREFVQLVDWDELQKLRSDILSIPKQRMSGDPRIYVVTTPSGMSFEIPVERIPDFLRILCTSLSPEKIDVFLQEDERSQEFSCMREEFLALLDSKIDLSGDVSAMIELDAHTLISGGGGCFSLALEGVSYKVRRKIAEETLKACGFDHRFKSDFFSAVVWEDKLEVKE